MKLVTFEHNGPRAGAVIGNMILELNAVQRFLPESIDEIIRRGLLPQVQNLVDNAAEYRRKHFKPFDETDLYPPVLRPGKIICLGLNYEGHAREQKKDPPPHPILFAKAPTALTGPFDDIVIRPGAEHVDAEAELAIVIGREGTMITVEEARNYIAGYMIFNDVSARRIQREDRQWFRGKSFDTFAPCGPWLVTPDEIGDPHALSIKQTLNGNTMQSSNTSEMIFSVFDIISFISSSLTLMPGDVIATGTPEGVGIYRDPPVFLVVGDVVEIEIERLGMLRNHVRRYE